MARYHINSKGEPGQCKAQQACPFGDASEHHDSPEAAREAFEAKQGSPFGTPALFDPRDETEYFIDFVVAERLREGDDYEGEEILTRKVGRKWVTLSTATRNEILVPLGEKIAVQRERSTASAREAERAYDKERGAKKSVEDAQANLDKALAEVTEEIQKHGYANYFRMDGLIRAQETNQIWKSVGHIAENNGKTYTEAVQIKVDQIKEGLTGYGFKSGTSRSTSAVSNLMDDAKNEAMIEFLRESERGWY